MIPLRLELTNFLSYRDATILDLRGVHTACIAGANGAGKSSLLDAITWSLFGQSRSRSDDDVVNRLAARAGETADVRFIFALEGNTYRVIRSKKPGRSVSLELQLEVGPDRWRSLSEGRVRETQAAIETLLKMSYDTFINASFLLQGKADEFTTKTPNRRKEILADLLGVSQWDRHRDRATEQRRATQGQLDLLDGRLADVEAELAEEDERRAELERQEAALELLQARLEARELALQEGRRRHDAMRHQRETVARLVRSVEHARTGLESSLAARRRREEERAAHAAILARATEIEADYAAWQRWEAECRQWTEKQGAARAVRERMQPHNVAIAGARSRLEEQVAGLQARRERVARQQEERVGLEAGQAAGEAELAAIQRKLADLAARESAHQDARERLLRLRGQRQLWQQEQSQLRAEAERAAAERRRRDQQEATRAEAESAVVDLQARLAALDAEHERLSAATAERQALEAEQPSLRKTMSKLQERIDGLAERPGGDCPLCGQPLSETHRQAALAELREQGRGHGDSFRANQERLKALAAEIADLDNALRGRPALERELTAQQGRLSAAAAQLSDLEERLAGWGNDGAVRLAELDKHLAADEAYRALEAEVANLEKAVADRAALEQARTAATEATAAAAARLEAIDQAVSEWKSSGEAALAAATAELAGDAFAADHRAAIAALRQEEAAVGYDPAAHDAARAQRDALSEAPAAWSELKEARAAAGSLDKALADLQEQIAGQEAHLVELEAGKATEEARLAELTAAAGDLEALEDEVAALRLESIQASQKVGGARQQLTVLEERRRQRADLAAERAALTTRMARLRLLEKACGRDGVQALLIEQALPEIEESANELLERLTNGEMRVLFETQRQLRSRDALAETLDIRITDGAGERPYENYSGGEQFRVNFAIRLALSRVLAGRAGARLQTLVIDEGFGSQDPEGRRRLVEAINTIQDEFGCILVITHIDQLRDAFPTRIQVDKGPAGSAITVL